MTVGIVAYFVVAGVALMVFSWRALRPGAATMPVSGDAGSERDETALEAELRMLRSELDLIRERSDRRKSELEDETQLLREMVLQLRAESVRSRRVSEKREADLQRLVSGSEARLSRLEVGDGARPLARRSMRTAVEDGPIEDVLTVAV